MHCNFLARGGRACPFGCRENWIICHSFLEGTCPCDQWEWCYYGHHTTKADLEAKHDPRNKAKYSSKPISEQVNSRKSRSRSTERKQRRAQADTLSEEASTRSMSCQEWELEQNLQSAMVDLGLYSLALPTADVADAAFNRVAAEAPNEEEVEKARHAYSIVRQAIDKKTSASSSSKDPPSSSHGQHYWKQTSSSSKDPPPPSHGDHSPKPAADGTKPPGH